MEIEDQLRYYLKLNYRILITPPHDENGDFVAEVLGLDGCVARAHTFRRLEQQIKDAKTAWFLSRLAQGRVIPHPETPVRFERQEIIDGRQAATLLGVSREWIRNLRLQGDLLPIFVAEKDEKEKSIPYYLRSDIEKFRGPDGKYRSLRKTRAPQP